MQIETAYDILFMQSMKKRLAGEGVAAKIRYADVAKRKPVKQVMYTPVLLVFLLRSTWWCLFLYKCRACALNRVGCNSYPAGAFHSMAYA